jgi:hypothetical protein
VVDATIDFPTHMNNKIDAILDSSLAPQPILCQLLVESQAGRSSSLILPPSMNIRRFGRFKMN